MEYVKRLLIKKDLESSTPKSSNNKTNELNINSTSLITETISKYKSKQYINKRIERETSFECLNIMELSKKLKAFKDTYFPIVNSNITALGNSPSTKNEVFYDIEIFCYKKISKDKIICEIIINKFLIKLEFIVSFLMKTTQKTQRKQFCGNLIEELIPLFNPIKSLRLYTDSINFTDGSMYTLKNMSFEFKKKILNKSLCPNNLFLSLKENKDKKYLEELFDEITNINKENFVIEENKKCIINKTRSSTFLNELKLNFYLQESESIENFFENLILNLIKAADFYPSSIHSKLNSDEKINQEKTALLEYIKNPKVKKLNLSIYFDFDKLMVFTNKNKVDNNNNNNENLFTNLLSLFEEAMLRFTQRKKAFLYLQQISLELVNTNTSSKAISDSKYIAINDLANFFLLNFIPDNLDIKVIEIMNKHNSKLADSQALFKYNLVNYSSEFSKVFNKIKLTNLLLTSNNELRKNLIITLFSFLENSKLNKLNTDDNEGKKESEAKLFTLFDNDAKFLQLNLSALKNKKAKNPDYNDSNKNNNLANQFEQINLNANNINIVSNPNSNEKADVKFIYNLKENFENILIRKVKTENIYKLITEKPNPKVNADAEKIENVIKLKPHDLATLSDIFSKLEGNKVLFLQDGRRISIGGKFNLTIYGNSFQMVLNTIIEVNADYTKMRIYTYNENYFLPMFNFAAEKFDFLSLLRDDEKSKKARLGFLSQLDAKSAEYPKLNKFLLAKISEFNKITNLKDLNLFTNNNHLNIFNELIFTTGGMSQQELISNFYFTPVFIIDTLNFDVVRVFQDKDVFQMLPGILFSHELKIFLNEEKFYLENIGGFRIENFVGGIKIGESLEQAGQSKTPKLAQNNQKFCFDIVNAKWKIEENKAI